MFEKQNKKTTTHMISSIMQALFEIRTQPNMSEHEKKRQRINDLLHAETKPKVFFRSN